MTCKITRLFIALVALTLLLSMGGCGKQQPAGMGADATDASLASTEDLLGFLDGYTSAQLAASTDPTLVVLYPVNNSTVWFDEVATEVELTFDVENWVWPATDKGVVCYIDDDEDDGADGDYTHTFTDVPLGMHKLCCTLTQTGQPLANCEATDCAEIMVTKECLYLVDNSCDDGNPCSAEACLYDPEIDHRRCVYGPTDDPDCCNSRFDCECGDAGWQVCADHQCVDCFVDDDCDDGNPCTTDTCGDGVCSFNWLSTPDGLCCTEASSAEGVCSDGIYCTSDLCAAIDPVTGTGHCTNPDAGFPDCCDSHADCQDGNPCTVNVCLGHECRQGPVDDPLCCNPNNGNQDCDDGQPCTIDTCITSTNQCDYTTLPFDQQGGESGPHCCEVHPDCMPGGLWEEDGDGDGDPGPNDPSTLDFCQDGQCQHVIDPAYCECMAGEGCEHACIPDSNICTNDQCSNNICSHPPITGCCNSKSDCGDGDICSVDTCEDNQCVYTDLVDCCNSHQDCDDGNPCNIDACLSHACHHGPDNQFPDCCATDADCEDHRDCTEEFCHVGTNTCIYDLVPNQDPACCFIASQCDDDDPGTTDICYQNECVNLTNPGSPCVSNSDCNDFEPCTANICGSDSNICEFVWIDGCCTSDLACNLPPLKPDTEEFACQEGSCDQETHTCTFQENELCCESAADCDDGEACTTDYCIDSECRFVTQTACCTSDQQCEDGNECTANFCQMNGDTGTCQSAVNPDGTCCTTVEDCSDGDICTQDICLDHYCYHGQVACCTPATEAEVCPDDNPCTCDLCIYGSCRHIPPDQAANLPACNVPPTCCVDSGDCDSDDNPCTIDECVDNICAYTLMDPCTLSLPFTESFDECNNVQEDQGWLLGKGWNLVSTGSADPTSNWRCSVSGDLGSSKHQRFNWAPTLSDFESYLVTPGLNAAGYSYVTVQYWDEFDYYDDVTPKTDLHRGLWVIEDTADPAGPDAGDTFHQVWTTPAPQEDAAAGLRHKTVPATTGWLSEELYVAWSIGGETSYAMNHLDLDEVKVCSGRPPVFSDPSGSSITASARLNETTYLDFVITDADGSDLSFAIEEGPQFAVIYSIVTNNAQGTTTVRVRLKPTDASNLGQHDLVISATDGCLDAQMTVDLWILLDEGYVVWDPSDGPWLSNFGDALEAAITANGRTVQRLDDISVFDDLDGVTAVFITTGVQGVDYVLTDTPAADGDAIDLLVDYLADEGRIYLEGGNTWGFDTGTDLHSQYFFPVTGAAGLPGIYSGPVKGKHFSWGEDFDVIDNALLNSAIDTLEKKLGSSAVPIQEDALGAFKTAIAYESAVFGSRTIAASLPFATLVEKGDGTLDSLMAKYIYFFENGWPPCENAHQCDDSELCTADACASATCQNTTVSDCIPCENDVPCTASSANKACQVSMGLCGNLPGTPWATSHGPVTIEHGVPAVSELTLNGTGTIQDLNVKLFMTHNYRGDLVVTLEHAGETVTLKDADVTDNGKNFYFTYDFGLPVADGDLSIFSGFGENGTWTITVTDEGIPFDGAFLGWTLFIVNDEVPTCVLDGDCDDGSACTVDTCTDGYCQFIQDPCDGANACQVYDHCDAATGCAYTALDCDDGNPCTVDTCDPATGCANTLVQYCSGSTCTTHADCGYDDYCHTASGLCTPIPADVIHHCWDQPGLCPQDVGDLASIDSTINLSDPSKYIDGIRVKVKMIHSTSGQLIISLTNGQSTVALHQLTGSSADDVFKVYEIADPAHVPGGLSKLLSYHPDGPWTLQVTDTVFGDTGTLEYWTLYLDVEDLKDDGDPCTWEDECASDYCGNGFCCEGTGTGDCCDGQDACQNHDDLIYWAASSCDDTATCQGHRVEPTCTDSECVITGIPDDSGCDGETAAACSDCRPQPICTDDQNQDDSTVRCPDTCGNDDVQCSDGCHCDGTMGFPDGICSDDLGLGDACEEESDCETGLHCQNGVCCPDGQVCCTTWGQCPDVDGIVNAGEHQFTSPECGGTPSTCQGARQDKLCENNQCTAEYADDDRGCGLGILHSHCGFYPSVYCDATIDQTPACASSCATDGDCDANAHCSAGACVGDYTNGESCEDGDGLGDAECISTHCQNGFCCSAGDCCAADSDCGGLGYDVAAWCASPATCQGSRNDATCTSFTCVTGSATDDDSACDVALSCAPYVYSYCDGTADQPLATCPTTCVDDADCVAAAHCRTGPPDGLKHCYYKKFNGEDCSGDYECVSGNCGGPVGQEICCAAGETCCPDNDSATCPGSFTLPAVCGDSAHCQGTQMVASCTAWACESVEVQEDSACTAIYTADGVDCGCYPAPICDGTSVQNPLCATFCGLDGECVAACHCDDTCESDLPNGDPCDEDSDCISGTCSPGGVCCDGSCDGTCESCVGSWDERTVTIDGDYDGADDFDALGHRIGTGASWVDYLVTWDDDYLYVAWEGPEHTQHKVYLALDADPSPDGDAGVSGSFGGLTFPGDRKPEYAVAFTEPNEIWLATDNGGAWATQDACTVFDCWWHYAGHSGNQSWELRIPLASVPLVDVDAGFGIWMWVNNNMETYVWSTWPSTNGVGPTVAASDAQYMSKGAGMCRNSWQNTDPDGDCAGDCQVCDGAGSCGAATLGTDPGDDCASSAPEACGLTGTCGVSGCAWWPNTTPCLAQHCEGTVQVGASFCSGATPGTCAPVGSLDCFPHLCAVDACLDPCGDNVHCVSGYYCNDRTLNGPSTDACEETLSDGLFCDEDSDCTNGHCVELGDVGQGAGIGVCCATGCTGHCNTCLTGSCTPHTDFTDPQDDCGGCQVCDGAGSCRNVAPDTDPSSDPKSFCAQGSLPIPDTVWDCGQSGRCDGSGGCEKWSDGEICHKASCINCKIEDQPDYCLATGECQYTGPGPICAGGLACANSIECLAGCDADSDCCGVFDTQLCHAATTCSACDDSPICPSNGSTCCGSDGCGDLKTIPITDGTFTYHTSTQGASDDSNHLGLGVAAPDRIFEIVTGPSARKLEVTVTGTDTDGGPVDTYIYLRRGDCATGTVDAVNEDCGGDPTAGSCFTLDLAASTTYYLVVDGQGGPTDKGDLAIEVTISSFCGNGICDPGEVCGVCADCSPCCGDGSCDLLDGESSCTCPADCSDTLASGNACNDGCCSTWDCNAACDQDCGMCADCGFCADPTGELEGYSPLGGALYELSGWSCDPDHAGDPVTVELYDGGLSTGVTTLATELRGDDPGGASCGTLVGFTADLTLATEGGHTITAKALSLDPGQPDAWLTGSVCVGVCGDNECGADGCSGSCGTCSPTCEHDGDGTYSEQAAVCAAGTCAAGAPCGAAYACDGSNSKTDGDTCATQCSSNDDDYCSADHTCEGTACVPKLPNGEECDGEDADCLSANCRKEISSSTYYCAAADKECSDQGGDGYDTGENEDPWICTGLDTSRECTAGTLCDTWIGQFCRADLTWEVGTGVSYVCDIVGFCVGDVRYGDHRCNGLVGLAGACDAGGDFAEGCSSETALDAEHCDSGAWIGVGATFCCENDGAGGGVAADPCQTRDTECVSGRTCLDGPDTCSMVAQGTLCNTTGYCTSTVATWCAPGKANGDVCAVDYECASKNCDPDLAGVSRCHATPSSCVQDATGTETATGAGFCVSGLQIRSCTNAVWSSAASCPGCQSCSGGACVDDNSNCVVSDWNSCASTCVKARTNNGQCTGAVCGSDTDFVAAGKVCVNGEEQDPDAAEYCDMKVSCSTGACAAPYSYRGCSGTGVSCVDSGMVAGGSWNAPAGVVIFENATHTGATLGDLSCLTLGAGQCDGTDHCTGAVLYDGFSCNGLGTCGQDKTPKGCCDHSVCASNQYCDTDYTCKPLELCGERSPSGQGQIPQDSTKDLRGECPDSGWDGCASTCIKTKSSSGTCSGSGYSCGTTAAALSVEGKVCSGGAEVAPSAATNCAPAVECFTGQCSGSLFYSGCMAGGVACSLVSGTWTYSGAWMAPYGTHIDEISERLGSSCSTTSALCDSSPYCLGDDRYSGKVCNGSGTCSAPSGDVGCCAHSDCDSADYCRASDYSCQGLSLCGKRTGGSYGEEHQDSDEDLRGDCPVEGCSSGFCLGTDFACNPGGKISPPDSVTGGTRNCAGSVTLQASGSTGSYAWYDVPVGGAPLASGPTFDTPEISATTTFYAEAVEAYPFPAHVLVFDENCLSPWPTPYKDAMDNLAWTYTRAYDEVDFMDKLTDGTTWDLVVFDRYYYITPSSVYDLLLAYVAGGGKLIFSNWKFTSHAIFSAMDVSYNYTFYSGRSIRAWNSAHPLYNEPNVIPTTIASTQDTCNVDGFATYVQAGGTAVAGFTSTVQNGQAAVVLNAEGSTIYMGEMPHLFDEPSLGNFLENQLMYMATDGWSGGGTGGICASERLPVVAEVGTLDPPAAADVSAPCGATTTLTATGSTGLYEWYDAPSGGTHLADGSTYTTPTLTGDETYYVEGVESHATNAEILVYDSDCVSPWLYPYTDVLTDMDLTFTQVTSQTAFVSQLQAQSWDLVIYNEYSYTAYTSTLNELEDHIDAGGKLIFSSWASSTHALFAKLNVGFNQAISSPLDIRAWDSSHALFTTPNPIPSVLEPAWNTCSTDGRRLINNGGVAVAGFTAVSATGQAAVVVGAGGNSIYMGQVPFTYNQATLQDFLENQIAYLIGVGDGCTSARTEVNVTATGACPVACTHQIKLYDTYGDGWNGGSVDVYVDGTPVLLGGTLANGYGPKTYSFSALDGATIQVNYSPGRWSYENYYRVYDGGANQIGYGEYESITATGSCP